jgi:hypothetical protein
LDQDCLQQDPKRPCLNPTLKRVGFKQEMQELPPESFVYQQTTITSQLNWGSIFLMMKADSCLLI